MHAENQAAHSAVDFGFLQVWFPPDNDVRRHAHNPKDLALLGTPPLSHDEAIQSGAAQNCCEKPGVPPSTLQGPGEPGTPLAPQHGVPPQPTSRKRKRRQKRAPSPVPAAVGGYGPINDEPGQIAVIPSTMITFAERKNTAYDVWAFVRGVQVEGNHLPIEQWPKDYDRHLTRRPETPLLGCKLCTEFG